MAKDAPKKPGIPQVAKEYDAKFRTERSRLRKFFDKGINAIYKGGAITRSHPIRRRATIASAGAGVLLGPGAGLLSELAGAAGGAALANIAAEFMPDQEMKLQDGPPRHSAYVRQFIRNDQIARLDGEAVADVALYVTTDPDMRSARANWADLSLPERKSVMKKVCDRFVGNYPGAERADVVFNYHKPVETKGPDGKPAKRVMGGAYVLVDEAEIPRIAKFVVGSSFFKKRIMMNAHEDANSFFGEFDGMVDIVVHESTHHLQRVLGKQARDELQAQGNWQGGLDAWSPDAARRNTGVDPVKLFWKSQFDQRARRELRTVREYMDQPIEGQAFSNGNMVRALATALRQTDQQTRDRLSGDRARLGRELMTGLSFSATWMPQIKKTLPGYTHPRLAPKASPAILGKPDSFKPIMDAVITESLKHIPAAGPRP